MGPGPDLGRNGETVADLLSLGYRVIPVTAKSVWEIVHLWRRRLGLEGWPLIAVAEAGGAIYAPPGLLSRPHGTLGDLGLEYMELGERIESYEPVLQDVLSVCKGFLRLSKASPREAAAITGLSPAEAVLASKRLYLEVVWHRDQGCLEKAEAEALYNGLFVHRSRSLLHMGAHKGKGYAAAVLLGEPALRPCRGRVYALGDSEADEDLMVIALKSYLIPSSAPRKPQAPVYEPVAYPAPQGWEEASLAIKRYWHSPTV